MFIKGVILSIALFAQMEGRGLPVSAKKPLAKPEKRKRGKVSRHGHSRNGGCATGRSSGFFGGSLKKLEADHGRQQPGSHQPKVPIDAASEIGDIALHIGDLALHIGDLAFQAGDVRLHVG